MLTKRGKRLPKHRVISDRIKKAILAGRLSPGDFLPSQNELVAQYGVALGTVRQALSSLERAGYVRPEKGRGVIVEYPGRQGGSLSEARLQTIGFASFTTTRGAVNSVLMEGASQAIQEAGKRLAYGSFPQMPGGADLTAFEEFLSHVFGVLLVDVTGPEVLRSVSRRNVKAVVVGYPVRPDPLFQGFHEVGIDGQLAGHLAAQALALSGHRRIGLVHQGDTEFTRHIQTGFRLACRDYEMQEVLCSGGPSLEDEIEVAHQVAQHKNLTGLVVVGDQHSCRMVHYLSEMGISVPRDRSVVSIGSLPRGLLSVPTLARVDFNLAMMGREAARLILEETACAVHKSIPLRFEKGSTLGVL